MKNYIAVVAVLLVVGGVLWFTQERKESTLTTIPCGTLPATDDSIPADAVHIDMEYLKDAQHVYLQRSDESEVIPGADPATFRVLSDPAPDEWGMDASHVYYAGCELVGADPVTFQYLPDGTYGKDHAHVYWRWYLLPGVDAKNFQTLPTDYGKDTHTVYYTYTPIPGADADTFETLGSDANGNGISKSCGGTCVYDAQDKNHKYLLGEIVD